MLGISESDIIYVDNPTRFKKVIVPENSTIITKYYTDKYILPFKILYNSVKPNNIDKVYFSRRNWKKNGAAIGESRIEKCFRDNGFQIFAPEKMRLAKMISILKGAKHIAGLVGTLTHNFIFANPKANIILLNREEYMNPSQEMIRKCLHQNASYIDVFMNILPVRPGTGPYIVGATSCFIDFCKSNHINPPKLQNQPTAKQITEFLTNWAQTEFLLRPSLCKHIKSFNPS